MLPIRQEQQAVLTVSMQERFLKRLAEHIGESHRSLYPDSTVDYTASESMARLRKEMQTLLDNGLENERDVVTAIEYFELFEVDFEDERILQILQEESKTADDKLVLLWDLRGS